VQPRTGETTAVRAAMARTGRRCSSSLARSKPALTRVSTRTSRCYTSSRRSSLQPRESMDCRTRHNFGSPQARILCFSPRFPNSVLRPVSRHERMSCNQASPHACSICWRPWMGGPNAPTPLTTL
jgi:5-methylcytosine-specific restriction endonuclease McrA